MAQILINHWSCASQRALRFLVTLSALALAGLALADIAPPEPAPGSAISPGQQTRVRMLEETVVIDVQARLQQWQGFPAVEALVEAKFVMHNTGETAETLEVRFPLGAPEHYYDEIQAQAFRVRVEGQDVPFTITTSGSGWQQVDWAVFTVHFPPAQDVHVAVTYSLLSTLSSYRPYPQFYYVLETGAGWQGSIGSAHIILRLPYEATAENVLLDRSTPNAKLLGHELHWTYEDLEPSAEHNLRFTLVRPQLWQEVLDARAALATQPENAMLQLALAGTYSRAFLPVLRDEALAQARALRPTTAAFHAGVADLLWREAKRNLQGAPSIYPDMYPELCEVLTELHLALALEEDNASALATFAHIQAWSEEPLVLSINPEEQSFCR